MKTKPSQVRFLPFLAAGFLGWLASSVLADVPQRAGFKASPAGVQVIHEDDYEERGWAKLRGAGVRGADGKLLGRIRDLILDSRSGEIRFAVVSSGVFGLGGEARLLPFEALMPDTKERNFLTRLQHIDWELLPVIDRADLKEGRVALTSQQRNNLTRLREQSWARSLDALAEPGTDTRVQRHVFAGALAGKSLYADNQEVGEVEDVFVDVAGKQAFAVVEIDPDYTGAEHDYVVPIESLQVTPGAGERVHTTLAAAEFRRAAGLNDTAFSGRDAGPWVRIDRDERSRRDRDDDDDRRVRTADAAAPAAAAPSPTGFPSSYRAANNTADLESAARAVQQIWEKDPELKRHNLRAVPRDDRIVLEGTVPTSELWERAEDAADQVLTRIRIDNRIHIADRR